MCSITSEQVGDRFVTVDQLKAGDVLLCYKAKKYDIVGERIRTVTKSDYTHAAIYIGSNEIAESMTSGVTITSISEFVRRYDHVAVFRQPDAWSTGRARILRTFVEGLASTGVKYNLSGVLSFKKRQKEHEQTLFAQLNDYFNGVRASTNQSKESYFCSELVADCFVITGFIQPTAAILYKSDTTSPGALGRDPTFGTFCGYMSHIDNYNVPQDDEFISSTTFNDIFGDE